MLRDVGVVRESVAGLHSECVGAIRYESLCKSLSASDELVFRDRMNAIEEWIASVFEVLDGAG